MSAFKPGQSDATNDTSTVDAWLIAIQIEYGRLAAVPAAW